MQIHKPTVVQGLWFVLLYTYMYKHLAWCFMENTSWNLDFMTIPCKLLIFTSFEDQELSLAKKQYIIQDIFSTTRL